MFHRFTHRHVIADHPRGFGVLAICSNRFTGNTRRMLFRPSHEATTYAVPLHEDAVRRLTNVPDPQTAVTVIGQMWTEHAHG